MPMGHSSQNYTQLILFCLVHHHQISVHLNPGLFLLYNHLCLDLSTGLAPDSEQMGPYRIFENAYQVASTP